MDQQRQGKATFLVAWLCREPVGFVLVKHQGIAGCFEAHDLYVVEAHRRRGYARRLIEAAEAAALARGAVWLGLKVRQDNEAARRLYDDRGYVVAPMPDVHWPEIFMRKDLL